MEAFIYPIHPIESYPIILSICLLIYPVPIEMEFSNFEPNDVLGSSENVVEYVQMI